MPDGLDFDVCEDCGYPTNDCLCGGDFSGTLNSLVECDHDELRKQLELRDAELKAMHSSAEHHSVKWSISQQRMGIGLLLKQLAPNGKMSLKKGE